MPQSQKDLDDLLQTYFNATEYRHLSIPSRTNFSKYLQSYYQIANDYSAQKFQCQYCKKSFAKHFIMPMYPQHSHLNEANTFLFCWGCLQAANGQDHMIHPGPWLNTTEESERSKTNPVLDLNILTNRPWSLQTLDQDYDTDFMPYVWIPAVSHEAQIYHEATFQHFWDNNLRRWRRTPLVCVTDKGGYFTPDAHKFQALTNRIWQNRAGKDGDHHQFYSKSESYAQALRELEQEFPDLPKKEMRLRVLQTLNFISQHATASFFQLDHTKRQAILTTFIQWETSRIRASLTGIDIKLHEFLHSDKNDTFLKQFWTVVLPTLHHHFICRNPKCMKVVLSHHWATNVKPSKRTQGHYLCPACLTYYRPWADRDHKKNPLLRPKQCLVVKTKCKHQSMGQMVAQRLVHRDRPDMHYFLYLMEWPETATDELLQDLKMHTADLVEEYDQATDRIAFLHEKIQTQLRHAQPLDYMHRAYWTKENIQALHDRNEQAGSIIYPIDNLPQAGPINDKRPFYDWCTYEYEEGVTHVLQPEEITKLMALTCCRLLVSSHTKETMLPAKRTHPAWTHSEWYPVYKGLIPGGEPRLHHHLPEHRGSTQVVIPLTLRWLWKIGSWSQAEWILWLHGTPRYRFSQLVFDDYSLQQIFACSIDNRTNHVSPTSSAGLASPTEASRLARLNSDHLSHNTNTTVFILVSNRTLIQFNMGHRHTTSHTHMCHTHHPPFTPPTLSLPLISFSPLTLFICHAFQRSPGILGIQELGTSFWTVWPNWRFLIELLCSTLMLRCYDSTIGTPLTLFYCYKPSG